MVKNNSDHRKRKRWKRHRERKTRKDEGREKRICPQDFKCAVSLAVVSHDRFKSIIHGMADGTGHWHPVSKMSSGLRHRGSSLNQRR